MTRRPTKLLTLCLTLVLSELDSAAKIDASLQMQLGNPSGATADTNNHDHYLIQRTVEAIDYSDNRGEPNWASWDLTAEDIGSSGRSTKFFVDTNLPANFHWVGTSEYSGSGYDRGHLCPSADRTDTTNNNNLVFFMSNMMPQTSSLNSGVWGNFESYCRSLVQSAENYELLIICGPSGFTGERINTNGYVWIPQFSWKIVVVVPPGSGYATNRITTTNRVIAIKVPNTNGVSSVWQNFVTSATQIEVDTGLTFFTALPPEVASVLRIKVDGQTNPPPVIYTFTPTTGDVNASVILSGTNFTGASAVTFNGTSASFTLDSDSQITALVPTNAGSGFLSVTTSSGTALSTNTFTVIHNGGDVYSGTLIGWDTSSLPGGSGNYGPSPFAPTTNAANLIVTGLTRGSGVKTSGTAAAAAWGGAGFTNISASAAAASNLFAFFSITPSTGYTVSFTSISRFDYYRSGTGPTNGVLQYQVGSAAFHDVTNLSYTTTSSGASIPAIALTEIAELQNVNTNVTFRIVNWGGGSSGTWYVYNTAGSTAPDFAVQGTVTQIPPAAPAEAPVITLLTFTNDQFRFSVTGSAGTNYVVEASTNLSSAFWVPVMTNAAPFDFGESNASQFQQRFYRAAVAP